MLRKSIILTKPKNLHPAAEPGPKAPILLPEYPAAARLTTFYGQSASLVRYLTARDDPETFLTFLERAPHVGYDAALRSAYGIENLRALEQLWLQSLESVQLADGR